MLPVIHDINNHMCIFLESNKDILKLQMWYRYVGVPFRLYRKAIKEAKKNYLTYELIKGGLNKVVHAWYIHSQSVPVSLPSFPIINLSSSKGHIPKPLLIHHSRLNYSRNTISNRKQPTEFTFSLSHVTAFKYWHKSLWLYLAS